MLENQTQPKPDKNNSIIKWAALTIGGCLVLIFYLALALALIWMFFSPNVGGIFSQIIAEPDGTPGVTQIKTASPTSQPHPKSKPNTMGDPNAPVKMIEYADFQCPYCQLYWHETEPQIINTYVATGKLYYEYRSVGAFIGPDSASAAEAAYCAGDQGKFWEYRDVLFSNLTGENVGDFAPDKLRRYAITIGLDQKTFDACLNQDMHASQIQQDVANAKADGIRSTPSFFINGKLVEGAQPFDAFQQVIEATLKGN